MDELNDRGGGQDARHQADDVAYAPDAKASDWREEEVVSDEGNRRGGRNRGAATQARGDGTHQQHKNQEKGLHPWDPQDPGEEGEPDRHDAYGGNGSRIGKNPPDHGCPRYGESG